MSATKFQFGPLLCSTHTIADLLTDIRYLLSNRADQPRTINCVNAHIFNLAHQDHELATLLNRSRILAVDGMSIVWAARALGIPLSARCNMTEAFRALVSDDTFPQTRAVLVGGTSQIAAQAGARIDASCEHMSVIASASGYLPEEAYRDFFQRIGPVDLVLLGLGTPKTERVSKLISDLRPDAVVWHIGGGTILFWAGVQVEAPAWMRRSGLQWLHRLAAEPKRMWRRYLVGNVLFLLRYLRWVFQSRMTGQTNGALHGTPVGEDGQCTQTYGKGGDTRSS